MLDPRGTPKLADLGLAKHIIDSRTSITLGGSFMGTPAYMSPDQARDAKVADTRDDIYSLGATFYECLTGVPPFQGETPYNIMSELLTKPSPRPRDLRPELRESTDLVCRKMMAKNRELRYAGTRDLVRDLHHLQHFGDRHREALGAATFERDADEARRLELRRESKYGISSEGVYADSHELPIEPDYPDPPSRARNRDAIGAAGWLIALVLVTTLVLAWPGRAIPSPISGNSSPPSALCPCPSHRRLPNRRRPMARPRVPSPRSRRSTTPAQPSRRRTTRRRLMKRRPLMSRLPSMNRPRLTSRPRRTTQRPRTTPAPRLLTRRPRAGRPARTFPLPPPPSPPRALPVQTSGALAAMPVTTNAPDATAALAGPPRAPRGDAPRPRTRQQRMAARMPPLASRRSRRIRPTCRPAARSRAPSPHATSPKRVSTPPSSRPPATRSCSASSASAIPPRCCQRRGPFSSTTRARPATRASSRSPTARWSRPARTLPSPSRPTTKGWCCRRARCRGLDRRSAHRAELRARRDGHGHRVPAHAAEEFRADVEGHALGPHRHRRRAQARRSDRAGRDRGRSSLTS